MQRQHQDYREPSEYSDTELLERYREAKSMGPQPRLDELQLEIAQRWERQHE